MRLLVVALVVCFVAVAQANKQGGTTKAAAACKSSADCKKTACGKATPPSCDKATKKCVCGKKGAKKVSKATTPEAKAEEEASTAMAAEEATGDPGSKALEAETKAPAEEGAEGTPPPAGGA